MNRVPLVKHVAPASNFRKGRCYQLILKKTTANKKSYEIAAVSGTANATEMEINFVDEAKL